MTTSTSRASIHSASNPLQRIAAAHSRAVHSSPCPTTKSANARVLVPAMDMALSMARRSLSSSSNAFMYAASSSGLVSSSSAVVRCLTSSFSSSRPYAGLRDDAMSVALMRQSVTLGSLLLMTPMADTTPNVFTPLLALLISRSQHPLMRSALPTHVPPNLCTSQPEPRATGPASGQATVGPTTFFVATTALMEVSMSAEEEAAAREREAAAAAARREEARAEEGAVPDAKALRCALRPLREEEEEEEERAAAAAGAIATA
mmetsp:Transcript_36478/g.90000  ORF Transcript_36478/g.90000 Transcript_36478/m.90000 type:complete len:261 (+) Transcript_36478:2247-3029(+)